MSATLYAQTAPRRGESGSDHCSVPADAIKRIEVLRDGASAQYGSDAISGVVNIILKDSPTEGALNLRGGITSKGDDARCAKAVLKQPLSTAIDGHWFG